MAEGASIALTDFATPPATNDNIFAFMEVGEDNGTLVIDLAADETFTDLNVQDTKLIDVRFDTSIFTFIGDGYTLFKLTTQNAGDLVIDASAATGAGAALTWTFQDIAGVAIVNVNGCSITPKGDSSFLVTLTSSGAPSPTNRIDFSNSGTYNADYASALHHKDPIHGSTGDFNLNETLFYFELSGSEPVSITLSGTFTLADSSYCSYVKEWYFTETGSPTISVDSDSSLCNMLFSLQGGGYLVIFNQYPSTFERTNSPVISEHVILGRSHTRSRKIAQVGNGYAMTGYFTDTYFQRIRDLEDMREDLTNTTFSFWFEHVRRSGYSLVRIVEFSSPIIPDHVKYCEYALVLKEAD